MLGINDQLISTMKSAMLTIAINGKTYETELQVVDRTFPIIGDGILGNPFLRDNQVIIDMS